MRRLSIFLTVLIILLSLPAVYAQTCLVTPLGSIQVNPASVDFGNVALGGSSTIQVQIENNDLYSSLQVNSFSSSNGDFQIVTSLPICIAPMTSQLIDVQFTPSALGTSSGVISLSHSDFDNSPSTIDVTGVGVTSLVSVDPAVLDFGTVIVGSSKDLMFDIIIGVTRLPITIDSIGNSNPGNFSVVSPAFPQTISSGGMVKVTVRFHPTSQGAKSGVLDLIGPSGSFSVMVSLRGTGGVNVPDIDSIPRRINFGNVALGTFKEAPIQILNVGKGTLEVHGLNFGLSCFGAPDFRPFSLAPGGKRNLMIRVDGCRPGPLTRILKVISNDPDEPLFPITLSANVIGNDFGFLKKPFDFPLDNVTGVQWIDCDMDGKLDLFLTGKGGVALFKNMGMGMFEDMTDMVGLGALMGNYTGGSWADADNNGFLDLFLSNGMGPSMVFMNMSCMFEPMNLSPFAISHPDALANNSRGGIWFDYDNDGDVDLFVVRNNQPNQLLENTGFFQFRNVAGAAGVAFKGPGRSALALDINDDSLQDIYVVNFNAPNRLYLNNGDGTFRDITSSSGANIVGAHLQAVSSDFDGDGDIDIFVVNAEGASTLLRNAGANRFTDATPGSGLLSLARARSASFNDFDIDGDEDLLVVQNPPGNVVFENNGQGRFARVPNVDLNAATPPNAVAGGDFNNDGQTDVSVGNNRQTGENTNTLFQNTGGGDNHYLVLVLQGNESNRSAIGAKVLLRAGLIFLAKEVTAGNGQNQESLPLEFGLAGNTQADVVINWPSGTIQTLNDLQVDRRITIQEP